jgi:hypothetical protein
MDVVHLDHLIFTASLSITNYEVVVIPALSICEDAGRILPGDGSRG